MSKPVNWVCGVGFELFNRGFQATANGYAKFVGVMLRVFALVLLLYGGVLGLTYWGFLHTPRGFIPSQDMGYLLVNIQLPDSASLERTQEVIVEMEEIAHKIKGVDATVGVAGQSLLMNAYGSNFGTMFLTLRPFDERTTPETYYEAIANQLRSQIPRVVTDAEVAVFGPPPVRRRRAGRRIHDHDRRPRRPGSAGAAEIHRSHRQGGEPREPELKGNTSVFRANVPQIFLDVDRTACMLKGVDLQDAFTTLQVYLGSLYVNDFNLFGRTWQVIAQSEAKFRDRKDDINRLRVRNTSGTMVPLGSVAQASEIDGPLVLTRYNMSPAASINGSAAPGVSSGRAIELLEEIAKDKLPKSMSFEWTELAYLELEAGNTAMLVFAFSIMMVFLVLAAQFESWSMPLAVILSVPLCVSSALIGLNMGKIIQWLPPVHRLLCKASIMVPTAMEINIFTQIGLVVLVGLASKNAILIVEFAKVIHRSGKPIREATLESCRLRLRPIIMTSMAFILGVLPLLNAHGAGAEMRKALGLAVFSGMLGVTLFGVLVTPVFFYLIDTRERVVVVQLAAGAAGRHVILGIVTLSYLWRPSRWQLQAPPGDGLSRRDKRRGISRSTEREVRNFVFSRFFIDRPIFASVLSIIITLAGGITLINLPVAQYPEITPPTVEVSAYYPGANAQVVADTVAAPIEQQVNGVENMMYMSSQCTNDGTYTLTVTFKPGVDLNMAQVLVQNRESLAEPILPDLVKRRGVSVKKKSPSILMIINIFSPNKSRDDLYLSNYATIQLRDVLGRLDGVGDITYIGQRNYSMRVWLDPQKMSFRNLTSSDVVTAITEQNVQVAAGQIGQPPVNTGQSFQFTITALGRLSNSEQFEDMILKTDPQGGVVRHARRGQGRAGRPGLRPGLHARRPAVGGPLGLSAPRVQRAGDRGARQEQDEGAEGALPRRAGLLDRLRYDPVHHRVGGRGVQDPARRRDPGRVRGALVPAKLAIGADPPGCGAGGDRGHFRGDGRARFLAQQPDALRAGAGHRHCG